MQPYPKGTFKIINTKTLLAIAMKASGKLELSYKEIIRAKKFLDDKLKKINTPGYAAWGSEDIKDLKREEKSFFVGESFVNCVEGWKKVDDILSFCDLNTLEFMFELENKTKNVQSSREF